MLLFMAHKQQQMHEQKQEHDRPWRDVWADVLPVLLDGGRQKTAAEFYARQSSGESTAQMFWHKVEPALLDSKYYDYSTPNKMRHGKVNFTTDEAFAEAGVPWPLYDLPAG